MDTSIYVACLRQVVAFAPKVIILPASGRWSHSLQGNYYCLPPAGVLHSQNKVKKGAAYGVAQARGWRYGFININDMYNNDVGKPPGEGWCRLGAFGGPLLRGMGG